MRERLVTAALAGLLAACSQGEPTSTTSDQGSDPESPTMETRAYNPWQDQMKALEKAKGVEGMLQQGAEARDRQLRQMEQ